MKTSVYCTDKIAEKVTLLSRHWLLFLQKAACKKKAERCVTSTEPESHQLNNGVSFDMKGASLTRLWTCYIDIET